MTTLEALEVRVKALEEAVDGNDFRGTRSGLFHDTVSRVDLTSLEASLRAEVAALRGIVTMQRSVWHDSMRPAAPAWDYELALFRYRTEARIEALGRQFIDFERHYAELRDAIARIRFAKLER